MDCLHKTFGLLLVLELFLLLVVLYTGVPNLPVRVECKHGNQETQPTNSGPYLFNCTNIHQIKIIYSLGHGQTKKTFLGNYMGYNVAVKFEYMSEKRFKRWTVLKKHDHIDAGLSNKWNMTRTKVMEEVLWSQQLNHTGLASLLGFCQHVNITSRQVNYFGPVSVYELGKPLHKHHHKYFPWEERLKYAIQLADLLEYLQKSPLGSLAFSDAKPVNMAIINGTIKILDNNSLDNRTITCEQYNKRLGSHLYKHIREDDRCQESRPQPDINAKYNMLVFNRHYFHVLFTPKRIPDDLKSTIERITHALNNLEMSASSLKSNLSLLL